MLQHDDKMLYDMCYVPHFQCVVTNVISNYTFKFLGGIVLQLARVKQFILKKTKM